MTARLNAVGPEERRFDRAAWITLTIGLLWFVAIPGLMLVNFNFPSDGWTNYKVQQSGGYTVGMNVTGKLSPLQKGDLVVAINGQPYREDPLPSVPMNPQFGQVVHYTVERNGQTIEVDATLVRRDVLALWRYFVQAWQDNFRDNLVASLSFLIAVCAFWLRSRNRAAQYLFLIFSFYCAVQWFGFADWHPYVYAYPLPLAAVNLFFTFSWAWYFFPTWTLLALTLPVRKAPLRHFPHLLPVLLYGIPFVVTFIASWFLFVTHNPFWPGLAFGVFSLGLAIFAIALLGSLTHNWLTLHEPSARAQLLWITLGLGVGWGVGIIGSLILQLLFDPSSYGGVWLQISGWLSLLLPICLTIAITRYRLFDIDVIIRRTLIYGALTAILALIYVSSIVILQRVVQTLTGVTQSPLATVASTLVIAALFQPLRRRIQRTIDRRFFRRKYDSQKTLEAFSARLRDQTDMQVLTDDMLSVAQETLQPAHVSLWLRTPDRTAGSPRYSEAAIAK